MLKKTTLAVLGLAFSGFAAAGTMGPVCAPGNVTVPCEAKLWDLGIQALYLKPMYSANKAYQFTDSAFNNYGAVGSDWDWGFRLEGSYHFNTGNDVTAVWMHYRDTVNGAGTSPIPNPAQVPPVIVRAFAATNTNQLDQVNLVMGQHVDMSASDKLRFYGGLQYAHISTNTTNAFVNSGVNALIATLNQVAYTDFKGVGPVVGLDYSYYLSSAFSLTANAAGSILYGPSRFSNGFLGLPANLIVASRSGKKNAISPGLEAKLGLNYEYAIGQGVLNLQAGYQALNYFHPIQTLGISFVTPAISDGDYGLYGPYFGIKYVGNA